MENPVSEPELDMEHRIQVRYGIQESRGGESHTSCLEGDNFEFRILREVWYDRGAADSMVLAGSCTRPSIMYKS